MDSTGGSTLACNLGALSAAQQQRRASLAEQMNAANQHTRELANGYAFRFPADLWLTVAEFIELERRCCPFFTFLLELEHDRGPLHFHITGGAGVKEFIQAELGLGS